MKNIFISLFLFVFVQSVFSQATFVQADPRTQVSFSDRLDFFGDMRFRYQHRFLNFDTDYSGYFIRVRGGLKGKINGTLDWGLRLVSGAWMNPLSEQRLGGLGGNPLWYDLAFVSYTPIENLNFKIGKMENPYFDELRYNLIWDSDLKPEGLSVHHTIDFLNNYKAHLSGSVFLRDIDSKGLDRENKISENKKRKVLNFDEYLWAGSGNILMSYEDYDCRMGIAFYKIHSKNGSTGKKENDIIGNSTVSEDRAEYVYDYSILDVFFQMHLRNLWKPLSLSVQLIRNFSVNDADSAMGAVAGALLGDKNKIHSWTIGYNFFHLDKDAVFSKYTDWDVGGVGVNYSGSQIDLAYLTHKNMRFGVKYILRQDKEGKNKDKMNHILFGSLSFKI